MDIILYKALSNGANHQLNAILSSIRAMDIKIIVCHTSELLGDYLQRQFRFGGDTIAIFMIHKKLNWIEFLCLEICSKKCKHFLFYQMIILIALLRFTKSTQDLLQQFNRIFMKSDVYWNIWLRIDTHVLFWMKLKSYEVILSITIAESIQGLFNSNWD